MSPARTPPGDGLSRSRDAVEAISTSTGHKNTRDKNEILQLLSLPHIQVGCFLFMFLFTNRFIVFRKMFSFLI